MKMREKLNKIRKNCPYLFCVTSLFCVMGIFVLGKNMIEGNCNLDYIKRHISEPIWEGMFEAESSQSVVAKAEADVEVKNFQKPVKSQEKEKGNQKEEKDSTGTDNKKEPKKNNADASKGKTESEKEQQAGITKFKKYTPSKISSPYYTDRGMTPLTTKYQYQTVDDTYFSDAAFIGDSRTLGLYDYSGWKKVADFYCESGFSLFQWTRGATVTCQNTGKKVNLKNALKSKTYGKVYLMIGMNDLGYGNSEKYAQWLSEMVEMIKKTQPKAIVYLMGNLHMSKSKNNMKTEFNNININDKNVSMASLADGINSFYLDCNPIFTDRNGYLKSDITFDGCHLYGYCYTKWTDFIKQHAIIR